MNSILKCISRAFSGQFTLVAAITLALNTPATAGGFDPKLFESIKPMEAEESLKTMVVQDGYHMELVAAEPMVEEPVLFVYDGDGRLYVAEMLTYMQDAEGSGKFNKTSRVKRLEDTDGDGVMDKFTIFADKLLLPRMILPLDDGRILVRETNTLDLLLMTDDNGDGKADRIETVYEGGPRGGNLEHQPNGLIYGIDNWLYVTYTDKRYKFVDGKVIAQDTAWGGGQWGIAQDHVGRMYFSTAGGQNPALNFQAPLIYSHIKVEGEQSEGFREVFPLDKTPDVQGGKKLLRDDNTLNHFTGGGGQSIYLGGLFGDMEGDYIITEPVGNLIRRADVIRENGHTTLVHPYQKERKEFIASTDPNFRPVWTDTAPDGSLQILDMYRGIIQEGNWTKKGSYLRGVIDEYGFDRNIGRGRLFRVTKKGAKYYSKPQMFSKKPAQLVEYLSHPNAWWRLQAQKLIVLSKDQSVVPALKSVATKHKNALARVHALWTLEGLGVVDKKLIYSKFFDKDVDVRTTAIRISEQLYAKNKDELQAQWKKLASDKDVEVVQQSVLSAYYVLADQRKSILAIANKNHAKKPGIVAVEVAMNNLEALAARREAMAAGGAELAKAVLEGEKIYKTLCYTCHGEDGKGTAAGTALLAPGFYDNSRISGNISLLTNLVLAGMAGPIDGIGYAAGSMQSLASNSDQWLANMLTYLRNDFGYELGLVTADQIKAIREQAGKRSRPWTQQELEQTFSQKLNSTKNDWKVSTNFKVHKKWPLENLYSGKNKKFGSQKRRTEGDAITISLSKPALLTELTLDSSGETDFYSRAYRIEVSHDGKNWKQVLENMTASEKDSNQLLGVTGQHIRITNLTGHSRRQWRIIDIDIRGRSL